MEVLERSKGPVEGRHKSVSSRVSVRPPHHSRDMADGGGFMDGSHSFTNNLVFASSFIVLTGPAMYLS